MHVTGLLTQHTIPVSGKSRMDLFVVVPIALTYLGKFIRKFITCRNNKKCWHSLTLCMDGMAPHAGMEWKRAQRKRERKHSNLYSKDTINIFMCATTVAPHRKGLSTYKWSIECRQIYDQNNICMRVCELRICERVCEYIFVFVKHIHNTRVLLTILRLRCLLIPPLFFITIVWGVQGCFYFSVGLRRFIAVIYKNTYYVYVYIPTHTIEQTHNAHDTTHQNK